MFKKYLNPIILILGVSTAIFSSYLNENKNIFLIVGILIMLLGLFRISTKIPSKKNDNQELVEDEEE